MIILIISIILINLMIWSSIILVAKWICLSCYMDLSKMFCVFLALCPSDFSLRESGKLELIWNVSTFPSHSLKVGIKHWKAFSNSFADSSKAACGDFPLISLCARKKCEVRKISYSLRSEKDLQFFEKWENSWSPSFSLTWRKKPQCYLSVPLPARGDIFVRERKRGCKRVKGNRCIGL